ncbi:Ger(x)C family spore germination protein [Caloramator sp. CAR-1]|uniref:Ger(x)C family spore germination protein n=1 Tax=Caloramator sp. CAR-1 TaxID=3062777 RepID=UPI0026E41460|nr:Ger(x)C family spore germination protein [Caloramator sp. CAR-1]MDO6354928.1 Ger(x)C family spore germination protein [Caloramator sp. CAR-1]
MNKIKIFLIIIFSLFFTSCWNYRELDQVSTAAGVAFDYDENKNKYILTVEIVTITNYGQGQSLILPEYFSEEGDTIFDAVRNLISKTGKKIFWSHAKVVFINKKLAKRGILPILDWIERDAEVRPDMKIVFVNSKMAKDVFTTTNNLQKIVSFHVYDILESSKNIAKYPNINLWQVINEIQSDSAATILPVAHIIEEKGRNIVKISGCALFKDAKLLGFLDDHNTKNLLFIKNQIKGGIIPIKNALSTGTDISFEIYNSQAKITPIVDDKVKFKIDISVDVSLAENSGEFDFIKEENLIKLKDFSEKYIAQDIENTLSIIQSYNADIVNFGRFLKIKYPTYWKKNKDNWNKIFQTVSYSVNVKLNIFGTATTSKIIRVGK